LFITDCCSLRIIGSRPGSPESSLLPHQTLSIQALIIDYSRKYPQIPPTSLQGHRPPFLGRSQLKQGTGGGDRKLTQILGVGNLSLKRVFWQSALFLQTFPGRVNPGVLRAFPAPGPGKRSPQRARIGGGTDREEVPSRWNQEVMGTNPGVGSGKDAEQRAGSLHPCGWNNGKKSRKKNFQKILRVFQKNFRNYLQKKSEKIFHTMTLHAILRTVRSMGSTAETLFFFTFIYSQQCVIYKKFGIGNRCILPDRYVSNDAGSRLRLQDTVGDG